MTILTPAQREAQAQPGCTWADRNFAITQVRPRCWTVEGLEGGFYASFFQQATSEVSAHVVVARKLSEQVDYLNKIAVDAGKEADAARRRASDLEVKLRKRTDQITGCVREREDLRRERYAYKLALDALRAGVQEALNTSVADFRIPGAS